MQPRQVNNPATSRNKYLLLAHPLLDSTPDYSKITGVAASIELHPGAILITTKLTCSELARNADDILGSQTEFTLIEPLDTCMAAKRGGEYLSKMQAFVEAGLDVMSS